LRALQEGEIQRVGADGVRHVDVRIVAATNRDLAREVEAGRFRRDLYHRLDVYQIRVPPLREHREDIPVLTGLFCDLARRRLGLGPVRIRPDALRALEVAPWPGNVRELENVLNRAALQCASRSPQRELVLIRAEDLVGLPGVRTDAEPPSDAPAPLLRGQPLPLKARLEEFQRGAIEQAVERNAGNWAAAARELGLHRSNLHHLARRLGMRESGRSDRRDRLR
ncbi:MAG: sigma 54-interacting transcriptional regulator, partial [Candidatus Eisenbacteria bacterium]|nr:sigma 54-interacting transcriptional regulator [Candidatus Eisenbacteria bacterium]